MPNANLKLVGTIGPGKTRTLRYKTIGRGQPVDRTVTGTVVQLSLVLDNEPVWMDQRTFDPPTVLQLRQGEAIDQALQRTANRGPMTFAGIWIPAYVAIPPLKNAQKATNP